MGDVGKQLEVVLIGWRWSERDIYIYIYRTETDMYISAIGLRLILLGV